MILKSNDYESLNKISKIFKETKNKNKNNNIWKWRITAIASHVSVDLTKNAKLDQLILMKLTNMFCK